MIRILIFLLVFFPFGSVQASSQSKGLDFLSSSEIAWLKQHGQQIRYAPIQDYPPIEFVDKDGIHKGITADYLLLIEEKTGIKFDKIYLKTWNEIIEGAKQGKIDVLGNLQNTTERSEYLSFTRPYITIPNVIIVQKQFPNKMELAQMGGMHVAIVKGYASIPFVQTQQPDIIIHPVDNDEQGLKMLSFGQLDGMITDLSVASFMIDKYGINNLKAAGNINYNWDMCIGVRKDWPMLHIIFEKTLASIDTAEREKIYKKWIHHEINPSFDWTRLIVFFLAAFFAVAFVVIWNFSLKRQVKKQTLDLKKELNERERITLKLKNSEEKFRLIFEYSPLAIFHLDKSGTVTACNENLCQIMGTSKSRLIGFNVLESLDDKKMLAAITDAFKGLESRYEGTYLSVTGGSQTLIRAIYAPIVTRLGVVTGVIGIIKDISEQALAEIEKKNLEAQLRQSQKMEAVGTLSSGIAHDFNNILGIILGNTDIVMMDLSGQKKAMKNLKMIKTACMRAADVIRSLLVFSRKTDPTRKPVQVNELIEESVKLLRSSIPAAIEIQMELSHRLRSIHADPTQIHQILINLCTNAAHAMADGGGVMKIKSSEITVDQLRLIDSQKVPPGDYVELTVSDSGHGIDTAIINRIFDPYFTTKEVGKGSGIGLSVVHGIVGDYGGFIFVDSKQGKGSVFRILFPIKEETVSIELSGSQKAVSDISETTAKNGKILVVDDEELLVTVIANMLKEMGYDVDPQTNPEKALDRFVSDPSGFRLVITDRTMPKMCGETLSEKILDVRPDIPIILCTGFTREIKISPANQERIKYLQKPFDRGQLFIAVREALNNA